MSDHSEGMLFCQMAREWQLAHLSHESSQESPKYPPWQGGEPKKLGTYLTTCVNGDGAKYMACHYWNNRWASPGPFVRVLGWMALPELTRRAPMDVADADYGD